MRKALSGILLGVLALMFVVLTTGSSSATPVVTPTPTVVKVEITRINYNANGADTLANRWKEGVYFKNVGTTDVNVTGWRVHDTYKNADDEYTNDFVIRKLNGNDVILQPGKSVLVTPASGTDHVTANGNTYVFYYNFTDKGYNGHVWNNISDTVFLKNASGVLVHRMSYSFENGYYVR